MEVQVRGAIVLLLMLIDLKKIIMTLQKARSEGGAGWDVGSKRRKQNRKPQDVQNPMKPSAGPRPTQWIVRSCQGSREIREKCQREFRFSLLANSIFPSCEAKCGMFGSVSVVSQGGLL
jgi:hypothetical protein